MNNDISFLSVSVGVLLAMAVVYFFHPATKDRASADCDSRAIEAKLVGVDKARHKNLCMKSAGFKRNTKCDNGHWNQEADQCYSYNWELWVDSAKLVN